MERYMNRKWTFTSAVIVAALSVAVLPAGAQGRERGGRPGGGGGQGGGGQAPRQQSAQQAAPRQAPPQARQSAPPPQARQQSAPRAPETRQYQAPPQAMTRAYESRPLPTAPQAVPRAYQNGQYQGAQPMQRVYDGRQYPARGRCLAATGRGPIRPLRLRRTWVVRTRRSRAATRDCTGKVRIRRSRAQSSVATAGRRTTAAPTARRTTAARTPITRGRTTRRSTSGRRTTRPITPYYFGHAYYSFRPYWNIGFGLWVGYSVPYPYGYFYSGYAPHVYGSYYPTTSYDSGSDYYGIEPYMATPAVTVYGGVSFDIQPSDADLFIDGEYVGTVGTFGPAGEPLTLTPGQHRIAIQRNGYRAMEWDVTIEPGQVIPYRGVMEKVLTALGFRRWASGLRITG